MEDPIIFTVVADREGNVSICANLKNRIDIELALKALHAFQGNLLEGLSKEIAKEAANECSPKTCPPDR